MSNYSQSSVHGSCRTVDNAPDATPPFHFLRLCVGGSEVLRDSGRLESEMSAVLMEPLKRVLQSNRCVWLQASSVRVWSRTLELQS